MCCIYCFESTNIAAQVYMCIVRCVREGCIPYYAEINNLQLARCYLVILGGCVVLKCLNALKELVSSPATRQLAKKISVCQLHMES